MGLPWYKWVLLLLCVVEIYGFNTERLEREDFNFQKDSFTNTQDEYLDDLEKPIPVETFHPIRVGDTTHPPANNETTPLDSWSVIWYIASFGGLIVFFLIVSCSEWCCRRAIRNHQQSCNRTAPSNTPSVPDTPPPSYEQFAPPSYESICLGRNNGEKSEYDIYVVPVHTLGSLVESRREDSPPSYLSASGGVVPRLQNNRVSRVT